MMKLANPRRLADLPGRRVKRVVVRATAWSVAGAMLAFVAPAAMAAPDKPTIALVGARSGALPPGQHDWPDGVIKIQRLIKGSPEFAAKNATVKLFPAGFPEDLSELDDADTIVLYFGVHDKLNPVEKPAVRQALDKLTARGVGLVALHQAFTVEAANAATAPFKNWLGGVRIAVTDYTIEAAPLKVAGKHPITNGVTNFAYPDEFYPTIDFGNNAGNTPILTAPIHVQGRGRERVFEEPSKTRVVAWAHERAGGGRSFSYSGLHYLDSFDEPQVRKMVLNAIMWSAGMDVPTAGATTVLPEAQRVVLPVGDVEVLPQPWGTLRWFAGREIGNSATMTVGQAIIDVENANPPHWHPNCDEVLHVVQGHIMHRVGDKEYEMKAGDTVVIPEGTVHNARNIGKEPAILMVSFNNADRVSLGE